MIVLTQFVRVLLVAVVLATCSAIPLRRSARQQTALGQAPYPAAGFRPKVPFDLPNEQRNPKVAPEPTTSTTAKPSPSPEDFDFSFAATSTQSTTNPDGDEQEERTPANSYGAPAINSQEVDDNSIEAAETVEPARFFQLPTREAVNFVKPIVDLPAHSGGEKAVETSVVSSVRNKAQHPANTYGPPKEKHVEPAYIEEEAVVDVVDEINDTDEKPDEAELGSEDRREDRSRDLDEVTAGGRRQPAEGSQDRREDRSRDLDEVAAEGRRQPAESYGAPPTYVAADSENALNRLSGPKVHPLELAYQWSDLRSGQAMLMPHFGQFYLAPMSGMQNVAQPARFRI